MNAKEKRQIEKLKGYSLSTIDIINAVDGKTKVYPYNEVAKYNDIDKLFAGNDSFVVLYLTSDNYGHWCTVNKITDNLIEFFDPYGYIVDSERKFIPVDVRKRLNQCCPHLAKLMYNSKYKLSYNNYKFQKMTNGVNTCGRHCVVRIMFNKLPLDEYKKMIDDLKEFGDADTIVTILTSNI